MEADLYTLADCITKGERNLIAKFLKEETRPLVEEDVPEKQRDVYLALEETEFPEYVKKVGDERLFVHWWLGGNFDEATIECELSNLIRAGALSTRAFLFVDGEASASLSQSPRGFECREFRQEPLEEAIWPACDDTSVIIEALSRLPV